MTITTTQSISRTDPRPSELLELRALSGRRCLVTSARGRHFILSAGTDDVLRLLEAAVDPERASTALPVDWPEAARSITALAEARPTIGGTARPVPMAGRWVLVGDSDLTSALRDLVDGADLEVFDGPLHEAVHRAFALDATLLVALRGHVATTLVDAERACADARVDWVPLVLERSRVQLGPWVHPGLGAGYEDQLARRISTAIDPEIQRALVTPSITGDCGTPPADCGALLAASLAALDDQQLRNGDVVLDIGPDLSVVTHPVLAMPGPRGVHRARPTADLIDPWHGIVTRLREIRHHSSVPATLRTVQADVCTMRRVSRWANSTSCQGSAFDDPISARQAAVGEAVERYCGNMLDTLPIRFGSWRELHGGAERVLDPRDLVLYSDAQYAAPGFPFVPLTPDLPVHWVPGRSLTRDEQVWVPASMVYVNWFTAGYSAAPVTNFCPFAGIAAGPDLDYATMSALEEVIERHATMVWWLNGQPLPRLSLADDLAALWQDVRSHGQRPELIALDNEYRVPVAAGVLWNEPEQLLTVGFSARADLPSAAHKAWTEALTLQEGARDLLDGTGRHWAAMHRGDLNGRSFKPWRADRRYLDDFRPDMHDCDDLMVQQQVHLDPRSQHRVRPLLDTPLRSTSDGMEPLASRRLEHYLERVHARGQEVIVVDITSADVAATGMRVVRVIVPGTVGNAPAAFPFLGGGVVQQLAVELGWRERPLSERELNHFPLPHA